MTATLEPTRRTTGVRRWHLVAGSVLLALVAYFSLGIGMEGVRPWDLLHPTDSQWLILRVSRIPRLVAILLAGGSLAVAGLIMQRITQNRFVSPSTSGTVEAAVLGVVISTLFFSGTSLLAKMVIAIGFAIVGTLGFLQIIERVRQRDGLIVALIGMMYGGVLSAIAVFLAFKFDLLQTVEIWTTGSFSKVLQGSYEPLYVVLLMGVIGYVFADRFTVIGMGENFAANLGVRYRQTLYVGLIIVSLMAAVEVVVVGAIPFLGLIVPNVVSMWFGDNVRRVLPLTALAGAAFVLVCDIAGRLIRYPAEIPVSTIAGVIGGVVFVYLVLRAARKVQP